MRPIAIYFLKAMVSALAAALIALLASESRSPFRNHDDGYQ